MSSRIILLYFDLGQEWRAWNYASVSLNLLLFYCLYKNWTCLFSYRNNKQNILKYCQEHWFLITKVFVEYSTIFVSFPLTTQISYCRDVDLSEDPLPVEEEAVLSQLSPECVLMLCISSSYHVRLRLLYSQP